ncbi:MAG: transposase domain-containing protein, partial [Thermoguttaceae bacterium]|nr:transposase domain-containing protein [Thermoguttaceae bacterium]
KNWLFFGSEQGGRTGTIIFTILRSAKLHGLNEFEYLHDILNRLADLPSEQALYDLLPDRWHKQD